MAIAETVELPDEPQCCSTAELGEALVRWGARAAAAESRWLAALAEFDRRKGWYLDGQLSAVSWLVWRCAMSSRTARDKLRVAHELRRRPLVAQAFASGRLSYCQVRAITRVTDADPDTDQWLLRLAEAGTVADLDRAVRPVGDPQGPGEGRGGVPAPLRAPGGTGQPDLDGMVVLEVVLPVEEGEEALRLLEAAEPVDRGSHEPPSTAVQRRADALMELLRAGQHGAAAGGSDRYTLHLMADVDALAERFGVRAELLDGAPLSGETLRRLSCDCGVVRHLLRGEGQPLDVGRRTAVWTTAQRRSISLRDRGHCRFVGCRQRTCDVHHVRHYEHGGRTAVDNGVLLCPRHHTAVHEGGFRITGEPNGSLTFRRPHGSVVGTS